MATVSDDFASALRGWFVHRGLDPLSPSLVGTPDRLLRALEEFTAGYDQDPEQILGRTFDVHRSDQPIIVSGIPFTSICEHHLLPFSGTAVIAYLPSQGERVVGLSKLPRLLDVYARRLQTQEQLTRQVTDALEKYLVIDGAACILRSEHGCLAHRGARKPGSVMVTTSFTGVYSLAAMRSELFSLINR
jgi:GTP cyclohydrolase I